MAAELNCTEVLIGCQGSGKSWHAMDRAAWLADDWDCRIVIHNSGSAAILKPENPYHDGADWKEYRQTCFDEKHRQIADPPRILFPPDILVVTTAYAEDALLYADSIRRGKEVVVIIDEVTAAKSITPQAIGDPWRTRIAQRRAFKTALYLCMQSPTMASRYMVSTATSVKCFNLGGKHLKSYKAAQDIGYSEEDCERIKRFKVGEYLELNQGFGVL